MSDICSFGNTDPTKNNYKEAERILSSTHLFMCGKSRPEESSTPGDFETVSITALCLSVSHLRKQEHRINGYLF